MHLTSGGKEKEGLGSRARYQMPECLLSECEFGPLYLLMVVVMNNVTPTGTY